MGNRNEDRLELLGQIASFYFEDGLSQQEIAVKTGFSSSMISRLLMESRKKGIVEIRVNHPLHRHKELEEELQEKLGIETVRVLAYDMISYPQMLRRLGGVAARLVEEHLHDHITIGVARGQAVYETVNSIHQNACLGANVFQLIGSMGALDPTLDVQEIARQLAKILVGSCSLLPAPLFVADEAARKSLLNDPHIQRVMEQFKTIELAIFGVGATEFDESNLVRAGYLNEDHLKELVENHAAGEICGHCFDLDGKLLNLSINQRVIGIDTGTLAAIPLKVAIAGGTHKVNPIIGASRTGMVNMLVTDEMTGASIVSSLKKMSSLQEVSQG